MRTLNTVEDVSAELQTSEENLKRLRNLLKETESNILAENSYQRYLKYRLGELRNKLDKTVLPNTDNQNQINEVAT
jgi:hypothetical protein